MCGLIGHMAAEFVDEDANKVTKSRSFPYGSWLRGFVLDCPFHRNNNVRGMGGGRGPGF